MTADQRRLAIAARLREAREYLGMSQDAVANAVGISRPAVTNLEAGSRKVDSLELAELARLYGKSVDYFLHGLESAGRSKQVEFLARKLDGLTSKDMDEVARFADFLRSSPKKGRGQE